MTRYTGQIQRPGTPPENVTLVIDRAKREYDSVTVTDTAYTVLEKVYILVDDDTAGGAVTITLPEAIGSTDKKIHVKKLGTTGNVTVDGSGSETIDGSATQSLTSQYQSITIVCDGSEWHILD